MLRLPSLIPSLMIALLAASLLPAQDERPAQQTDENRQQQKANEDKPKLSAEDSHLVEALAGWLKTANQVEVELGQLASQKASNAEVKEFAQLMVETHKEYISKLEKFTKDETPSVARTDRQEDQTPERPTARTEDREGERAGAARPEFPGGKHATMQEIGKRAGELKIEMTKKLLNEYQGHDFDMAYVGDQISAHIDLLAHLKAIEKHSEGEFAEVVEEGLKTTESHLKKVKELSNQLQQSRGGAESNR